MERMMQAVRNARQAREEQEDRDFITPTPVLVPGNGQNSINYERADTVTLDSAVLHENRILTGVEPDIFSESYRLLRTQILHRFRKNNWNALAVTSPGDGEGKTLTAINLAITMAREVSLSVLLVDANMRQSRMLKYFGLADRKGLSDYLTDNIPVEDLLVQPDIYNDLVILPGGQPLDNSAELLNSPKMGQLVSKMRAGNDNRIIIFNLPSVLTTTDALAFSPQVDAALLVIEDGVTTKSDIERTMGRLDRTSIVGTVLNKSRSAMS